MKPISRREKVIVVIIVLLLHILLIFLLAYLKQEFPLVPPTNIEYSFMQDKPEPTVIPPPAQPQQDDEEWVAHAGDGSLPSLDNPQETAEHQEQETEPENPDNAPEETSEESEEPEIEQEKSTEETPAAQQPEQKQTLDIQFQEKAESRPKTAKSLPTLADIAKGFTKQLQTQRGTGITTDSRRSGVVSGKQILCEQFEHKVMRAICNTFRVHRDEMPGCAQSFQAGIQFALDEHGQLISLQILGSTGSAAIDAFVRRMVHEAHKAFPPIPSGIGKTIYPFPVISFNSLQDFLNPVAAWRRTS